MNINFYKPQSSILKKYMLGYYIISKNENDKPFQYLTFPNNYCILSISLNAAVTLEPKKITVRPSKKRNISAGLVFRYINPIEIYYEKPVEEITIYFKPLGLHYFIDKPEHLFLQNNISEFDPFPDFKEKMYSIFATPKDEARRNAFENYWLSKLKEKDLSFMEKLISDVAADHKIGEIAKKHSISRQYLNRIFLTAIGKPPSEYRKIDRFRSSLANRNNIKNLTELSNENLFYDQSHFIRNFKDLTSLSPHAFFKKVDVSKKNIWLFI